MRIYNKNAMFSIITLISAHSTLVILFNVNHRVKLKIIVNNFTMLSIAAQYRKKLE